MAQVLGVDASALFAGDLWHKDDGTEWVIVSSAEWNGVQREDTLTGELDVTWLALPASGGAVQRFVAAGSCPVFVTPEYARG